MKTKKVLTLISFLFLLGVAQTVFSHGTVIYPASRIYNCYKNPSNPLCGSCGNAIYNWMGVLQPNTEFGNHRKFVPDGQIASGGNGSAINFSCLDVLTTDWPATTVNHGYIDVLWQNTAPHKTQYYKVYITPLNWDPTKPLRWDELIEIGSVGKRPPESFTTIKSFIPDSYIGKRAALISVWQRDYNDSHEAFYSVSDILVAGGSGCTTGSPINATFTNNTNCTLQYYQNNVLKGTVNSGGSYTVNTTVGTQWEARQTSGEQVDNFTVACDQPTYTSTQCNSGCTNGDAISVTFTNNTNCKLQYYHHNTLKGSANAGESYTVNTTVGSHWDVLELSGERLSHFHIVCDQTTYNSKGSCNKSKGCDGLDTWFPNSIYLVGNKVVHNGIKYEAKWWTRGKNPARNSGTHQVWKKLEPCSSGGCTPGDAVSITFTNNTNCTLQYYHHNTLKGSANVGESYTVNTTVGSHWEARQVSGNQVSNFHIVCDKATYNSQGNCTSNVGCDGLDKWSANSIYLVGNKVVHNGIKYEAKWWTKEQNPSQYSGTYQVWKKLGPCSSGGCTPGDAVSVTFTNNTNCTLQYYHDNTLKGSANAGGSYTVNTTSGSHWEARQTSGNQVSNFHIVCDQAIYNSTENCDNDMGECAPAYRPYPKVYMADDIVSYNGNNYKCLSDNIFNIIPGTMAHWWKDLGPCSTNSNKKVSLVVFPNPAKDVINLEILRPKSSDYAIVIKNLDGKTLKTIKLKVAEGLTKVNTHVKLDGLLPGTYFINVISDKRTRSRRIIVK